MRELVFLLEEPSAKAMLESLLPRMLKQDTLFRCIPFEGKQDLEKQLTRRIRAYQNERARFIVLRDQDSHPDCTAVKQGLLDLCDKSGKFARCLVRIACRELEAFYLADLQAVERALEIDGLTRHQNSRNANTNGTDKGKFDGHIFMPQFALDAHILSAQQQPGNAAKNGRVASGSPCL